MFLQHIKKPDTKTGADKRALAVASGFCLIAQVLISCLCHDVVPVCATEDCAGECAAISASSGEHACCVEGAQITLSSETSAASLAKAPDCGAGVPFRFCEAASGDAFFRNIRPALQNAPPPPFAPYLKTQIRILC